MSLISRLLDAVHSWRRRGGGPKPGRRADVSMEQLDHRQLLSVNFTGNVATDFPVSTSPGVVVLPDNPNVRHPTISPDIAPIVKVSGFDINAIRVTYTSADDTLSIGLEQPASQQAGQPGPVIAGDADNNGNDGTVNPAVTAIKGSGFRDFPDFGGSESMAAFLDLKGSGYADVVAGFSLSDPRSPKQYQVAQAVVNTNAPPTAPDFGTELPAFEGNVYKVNSPAHPNLEFSITHFSELYLAETGKALTSDSVIRIGAAAGSADDLGIGEEFFPEAPFGVGAATLTPPTCPPASPPVILNFHENQHINTAHPDLVRAYVLGSSGFDVSKIIPSTVILGGAHPIFSFDRFVNADNWPDATFVFKGDSISLPPGHTTATITGQLTDGTSFSSSVNVFNRDRSFYTAAQNQSQMARETARETRHNGFVVLPPNASLAVKKAANTTESVAPATSSPKVSMTVPLTSKATPAAVPATTGPVVSIKRREPVVSGGHGVSIQGTKLSSKLQSSLNQYVRANGAVNVATGAPIASAVPGIVGTQPKLSAKLQASLNKYVRAHGAVNLGTGAPIASGGA
jgi:hypothetical protein